MRRSDHRLAGCGVRHARAHDELSHSPAPQSAPRHVLQTSCATHTTSTYPQLPPSPPCATASPTLEPSCQSPHKSLPFWRAERTSASLPTVTINRQFNTTESVKYVSRALVPATTGSGGSPCVACVQPGKMSQSWSSSSSSQSLLLSSLYLDSLTEATMYKSLRTKRGSIKREFIEPAPSATPFPRPSAVVPATPVVAASNPVRVC